MAKIKDPNAGIPGGYYPTEDGGATNALGEPIPVMSQADIDAALVQARGEPKKKAPVPPAPVVEQVVVVK